MIRDISELNKEIETLEAKQTTLPVIEKLAMLYIVRDHNQTTKKRQIIGYSQSSGSDFVSAASAAPIDGLISVMDEHMEAIRLIYPKEYESVLQKIREL